MSALELGSEEKEPILDDYKAKLPETEYDANVGDSMCQNLVDLTDKLSRADSALVRSMHPHESLLDALRAIQRDGEELVANWSGETCCWCWGTSILEGQIGCATRFGKAYFIGPGMYLRFPVGVTLEKIEDVETKDKSGTDFHFKDVSYLHLAENNLGVVQVGERLLVLGGGRYLLRHPAVSYGMVDIQNLKDPVHVDVTVEKRGDIKAGMDPRDVLDEVTTRPLLAGHVQTINSVTFVRARPGFCWVVQNAHGDLVSGIGLTICKGGTKFEGFVDRNHYARTTQRFTMESLDRQEVTVRAQIRWRLEKAKLWIRYKGVAQDVFQALQETIQSLLRDAIAGSSYEECSTTGYDKIEIMVFNELKKQTSRFGARLLGFEIRELRFRLLEKKNKERAEKETLMDEKLYEEKRNLDIETENRKRIEAKRVYDMEMEQLRLSHSAAKQILQDQASLQAMREKAELDKTKERLALEKEELRLQALRKQQDIKLEIKEIAAQSDADDVQIIQGGKAKAQLVKEEMEAKEFTIRGTAQAQAKVLEAAAESKATQLLAATYGKNPQFLKIETAKLHAKVMKMRAQAMADALGANSSSLMPIEFQRELNFLRTGISPIAPMVIPVGANGAGVVVCSPDENAKIGRNVQLRAAPGPPEKQR